jgi:hypothetical protein
LPGQERVEQRIVWDCGRGRPRKLTLPQAVKAVVMYFRTNVTEELIGELLFVDQSTISRSISDLEEIIAEALDEFIPDPSEEIAGRIGMGIHFGCETPAALSPPVARPGTGGVSGVSGLPDTPPNQ